MAAPLVLRLHPVLGTDHNHLRLSRSHALGNLVVAVLLVGTGGLFVRRLSANPYEGEWL